MRGVIGRRAYFVAVVALAALARLVVPTGMESARAADAAFVLGSGAASAVVTKARLFYAGYSLTLPMGLSATTYENRQSRALGSAYDLSAALGLASVKQPQLSPISIDSNKGDASQSSSVGAGDSLGHIALRARAVPSSQSDIHLADVDLPGLLRVEGGRSHSNSEVVDGKQRVAESSADIASVSLAGGLVVLKGLHWDAVQRTGAVKQADASFTLGSLLIAGVPLATDARDLAPVLAQVNKALAPTGLVLEAPVVARRDNGAVDVSGIRVGVINSPLGGQYLGPLIAKLRPPLLPLFDTLANANSTLGLSALVVDLGLGVVDGSGGIELTIGGATARTDDKVFANPLGGVDVPPSVVPGIIPSLQAFDAVAPLPGIAGTPGSEALAISPAQAARCVLSSGANRKGGCRGTNVAGAIGVVGLVVAGLATYEAAARRRRATTAVGETR